MLSAAAQDDREVVLAATSERGSSLVHASSRLRAERAVVLCAVSPDAREWGCKFKLVGKGYSDIKRIRMCERWTWTSEMFFASALAI